MLLDVNIHLGQRVSSLQKAGTHLVTVLLQPPTHLPIDLISLASLGVPGAPPVVDPVAGHSDRPHHNVVLGQEHGLSTSICRAAAAGRQGG
jgi:hypothetical protein